MNKERCAPIDDLLQTLTEHLSPGEILTAMRQSDIACAIASARVSRGMNQAEFAQFMGVKQPQISKWESGDFNFTISKLAEIAEKLDLDFECSLKSKAIPANVSEPRRNGKVIEMFSKPQGHWNNNTLSTFDWVCSNPKDTEERKEM